MKTTLTLFCSVALIAIVMEFSFNSDKGPALQSDGISELKTPAADSLVMRGKRLIDPMHYTDQDLQAIAAFLNSR
jgi:hypothetical protein